jgi:hypothetical protein
MMAEVLEFEDRPKVSAGSETRSLNFALVHAGSFALHSLAQLQFKNLAVSASKLDDGLTSKRASV